jgi:hypothetical protein
MLSHPVLKFTIKEDSERGDKDEANRDADQHQINDFD